MANTAAYGSLSHVSEPGNRLLERAATPGLCAVQCGEAAQPKTSAFWPSAGSNAVF